MRYVRFEGLHDTGNGLAKEPGFVMVHFDCCTAQLSHMWHIKLSFITHTGCAQPVLSVTAVSLSQACLIISDTEASHARTAQTGITSNRCQLGSRNDEMPTLS